MPQVPIYQRTERQRPVNQQGVSVQASPGDFGAQIGQGMQAVAQGLSDVQKAAQAVHDKDMEARAKEADNRLAAFDREAKYGENGYLLLQGQAAVDGRSAYEQRFAEEKKRIADELPPAARDMFTTAADSRENTSFQQSIIHQGKERKQWYQDASVARQDTFANDALTEYGNPDQVNRHIAAGLAEIQQQATEQGLPPEAIRLKAEAYESSIRRNVALRLAEDDPLKAKSYLDANIKRMTGEDAYAVDKSIKSGVKDADAKVEANRIWEETRRPSAPAPGQPITGKTVGQTGPSSMRAFLISRAPGKGPEAIDGLDNGFATNITAMIQSAPPEIRDGLQIMSGHRSVERQSQLWQGALAKYGSSDAARKWVAPPGKSNHNHGRAVDLMWNGKTLKAGSAPDNVIEWVHANAGKFGLYFPLSNEDWHIEPQGTRGGNVQAIPSGSGPGPTPQAIEERIRAIPDPDVRDRVTRQLSGQLAQSKADYSNYDDTIGLKILQHQVADERDILDDEVLTVGDKVKHLKAYREEMKDSYDLGQNIAAFTAGSFKVDPYDTKGREATDKLFEGVAKVVPQEQVAPMAEDIVRQSGVVPKQVMSNLRQGMESRNSTDVMAAAQQAVRFSQIDPAALSRREGGKDIQAKADDFNHMVNTLNMTPEQAAQRIADNNDPEKQRDRKSLEPAAKEFRKTVEKEDLGSMFDDSYLPFNDPQVGFSEGQAYGIKADYLAIAEEQFYLANGDATLAMNRAKQEMQRIYGVTQMTGKKVIMKHPPERYWPQAKPEGFDQTVFGNRFDWAIRQLGDDLYAIDKNIPHTWEMSNNPDGTQSVTPRVDLSKVEFTATPETDAMVKRGEMPAYLVSYRDENGNIQTIPGKMWRPDAKRMLDRNSVLEKELQEKRLKNARETQPDERKRADLQNSEDGGRAASLDAFLDGPDALAIDKTPEAAKPSGDFAGMVEDGNIDLANRPQVKNDDGSISTVRSISFEEDGTQVLIPTVSPDGQILTDDDAIALYHETGQFLGKFKTEKQADTYAEALHQAQARFYSGKSD